MIDLRRNSAADKMVRDLKFQISNNILPAGSFFLSTSALAEKYSLSPTTVHKALVEMEKDGWIVRKRGKGTFVAGRKIRTGDVGLFIPNIVNPEFPEFAQEFMKSCEEKGWRVIIGEGGATEDRERTFYYKLKEKGVKKLVRFPDILPAEKKMKQIIKDLGFHMIMVNDFWFEDREFSSVKVDEILGMEKVMKHLIGLGHRTIAYLDVKNEIRNDYMNTYLSVVKQNSLQKNVILLTPLITTEPLDMEQGAKAIIDSGVTAVITPYDMLSIDLIRKIKRNSLAVPDNISVVGFGDIEMASYEEFLLTTVGFSRKELAKETIRLLLSESEFIKRVIIEPQLIVRRTTGPCKTA